MDHMENIVKYSLPIRVESEGFFRNPCKIKYARGIVTEIKGRGSIPPIISLYILYIYIYIYELIRLEEEISDQTKKYTLG